MHAVYQEQIVGHIQIYLQRFEKSHIYEYHYMLLSYVVQSVWGNIAHIKKEKEQKKELENT